MLITRSIEKCLMFLMSFLNLITIDDSGFPFYIINLYSSRNTLDILYIGGSIMPYTVT